MNFALVGYGKMGRAIEPVACGRGHRRVAVVAGPHEPIARASLAQAEVAFEFTCPEAAAHNVRALIDAGVAVVCGTTGWQPDAQLAAAIDRARVGVVLAPNFSLGVHAFFRIVEHAARLLGPTGLFDPFVQEIHHREKRDAPSGTAARLAAALLAAAPERTHLVLGNPAGALDPRAIQVSSVRAGSEPGTHTVGFEGEHERITLEHRSRSRSGFALGAVLAGEWVRGRAGLHGFDGVADAILGSAAAGGARLPEDRP